MKAKGRYRLETENHVSRVSRLRVCCVGRCVGRSHGTKTNLKACSMANGDPELYGKALNRKTCDARQLGIRWKLTSDSIIH